MFFLHSDHTAQRAATARQLYDAWGNIRASASSGTMPTDIGYTGQRLDTSTGLMYYRARYYAQGLGRFLSADTIVPDGKNPQAFNRYAYTLNNPVKYNDPTGHSPCDGQYGCEANPQQPKHNRPLKLPVVQPLQISTVLPTGITYSDPLQWDNPKWLDGGIEFMDAAGWHVGVSTSVLGIPGLENVLLNNPELVGLYVAAKFSSISASYERVTAFTTYEHGAWEAEYLTLAIQSSLPVPKKGLGASLGIDIVGQIDKPEDLGGWSTAIGVDTRIKGYPVNFETAKSRTGPTRVASVNLAPGAMPFRAYIGPTYTIMINKRSLGTPYSPCAGMAILPNGGVCGVR